ncbi:MAG TPA: hypothetical protein VGJ63_07240 [Micromonosporaceae bacterium]|jgi:hypothetical protein
MGDEPVREQVPAPIGVADDVPALEPAPRSRVRMVVLAALLVVGLVGAAILGTAGWRVVREKDARLSTPEEVAGMRRDRTTQAQETAEYLRAALAAGVNLDSSVGAVYEDPAARDRSVLFFGGTGLLLSPGRKLDTVFRLLADENGGVAGIREVPAGRLGGVMRCGRTATPDDGGDMAVCGWADHGSVAAALFENRSTDDSARLLRSIRAAVQTRS